MVSGIRWNGVTHSISKRGNIWQVGGGVVVNNDLLLRRGLGVALTKHQRSRRAFVQSVRHVACVSLANQYVLRPLQNQNITSH
jgi:hypothetical protein